MNIEHILVANRGRFLALNSCKAVAVSAPSKDDSRAFALSDSGKLVQITGFRLDRLVRRLKDARFEHAETNPALAQKLAQLVASWDGNSPVDQTSMKAA